MSEKIQVPQGQYDVLKMEASREELEKFEPIPETPVATTPPEDVIEEPEVEEGDNKGLTEDVEVEEATEVTDAEPEESEEPETTDQADEDVPQEGEEVELPDGERMRFDQGEWKYIVISNGVETLVPSPEIRRMRYSNAAITQGFQQLAQERADIERMRMEQKNWNDIASLYDNPTPVVPKNQDNGLNFDFDDPAPQDNSQVQALMQEVNQLKQQINGFTTQNNQRAQAIKVAQQSVSFMRSMGVEVPEDLTALDHAIAAETGGIGTPEFYQKAQDPMYMNDKIREVYGGEKSKKVDPQKPEKLVRRLRKPPVSPNRTKTVKREAQTIVKRKDLEKQLSEAIQKTNEINSGPELTKWGVKVQELQMKLSNLDKKGSSHG